MVGTDKKKILNEIKNYLAVELGNNQLYKELNGIVEFSRFDAFGRPIPPNSSEGARLIFKVKKKWRVNKFNSLFSLNFSFSPFTKDRVSIIVAIFPDAYNDAFGRKSADKYIDLIDKIIQNAFRITISHNKGLVISYSYFNVASNFKPEILNIRRTLGE